MREGKEWEKAPEICHCYNVVDTSVTILQYLNMSNILHMGKFHIFLDLNSYLRH